MTPHAALTDLLTRLAAQDSGAVHVGVDDTSQWPAALVAAAKSAGLLKKARPASSIACSGCERQCMMPVQVFPETDGRPARAFISCDKPEDMGRVQVEPSDLVRWRITDESLARALSSLLLISDPPQRDCIDRRWIIGPFPGHKEPHWFTLALDDDVTLLAAQRRISLITLLKLDGEALHIDDATLLALIESDTRQPKSEKGSAEWRRQSAKAAADARHDQPGGSREKQRLIRERWASGKYSTRDICAEQECAALDMSFSAARKALRNTPNPDQST